MRPVAFVLVVLAVFATPALSQSGSSPRGIMFGASGGVTIIDESVFFGGLVARPVPWLHFGTYRPGRLGPEFAVQVIPDALSVSVTANLDAGVSYQFGRHFALGGGGSIIFGDLNPLIGGYVGLMWMPLQISSRLALFVHGRQHVLFSTDASGVALYPGAAAGMMVVPRNALRRAT